MLRSTERSGGGAPVSKRRSIPKHGSAHPPPRCRANALTMLKLEFALWTREAVATLIQREDQHGAPVAVAVGNYLRSWGFTRAAADPQSNRASGGGAFNGGSSTTIR